MPLTPIATAAPFLQACVQSLFNLAKLSIQHNRWQRVPSFHDMRCEKGLPGVCFKFVPSSWDPLWPRIAVPPSPHRIYPRESPGLVAGSEGRSDSGTCPRSFRKHLAEQEFETTSQVLEK